MLRSLFSGVSGLRIHQTKLDVIANNISNVNTVGFKRSVTTFNDVINQNLSGATRASEETGRGGTNPMQIGLGSNVSSINTVMTPGSAERTDGANDVMISGDGFFIVSDVTGFYFTRAGAFQLDEAGNLIDSNGLRVCGWSTDENDQIQKGRVDGINLYENNKSYLLPQVTDSISFSGNLNSTTDPEKVSTVTFFDSLGNRYTVNTKFTYDQASKSWNFSMENTAMVNGNSKQTVEFTGLDAITFNLTFDDDGTLVNNTAGQDLQLSLAITPDANFPFNSTFADEITIDFSKLTQFNSTTNASANNDNGYEAGSLKGYSIGSDGIITGQYTNGLTKTLGQIAIADFVNPSGLEKVGSNLYQTTVNSGEFDGIGVEVGASGGEFIGGSLEMSNVDLSYEFTQMITTQRGFQANSRIISTSDEILQELVNLKR